MMRNAIHKGKLNVFVIYNSQACHSVARLFIGHSNGAHIKRIGITITRVQQIETFAGKEKPAVFIKIFGIVLPYFVLEFTLPIGYYFVIRLRSRCKIIRVINELFMKINVYLRHPLIIDF